jgi:hypothetical protein
MEQVTINVITTNELVDIVISGTGPAGPVGPAGPAGPTGAGVPVGGTAGQVLSKIDATDYNTLWVTGGGSASWGAITGTLSAQTDLQTALNGKVATTRTLTTTSPLTGGGDLSADRTLGINQSLLTLAQSQITNLVTDLAAKEPALGNPASNGYVLSSTTGGARSWIAAVRLKTANAVFASEDHSVLVTVADTSTTANTLVAVGFNQEDAIVQGMTGYALTLNAGVGYDILVNAPDGATGTFSLRITAQEGI